MTDLRPTMLSNSELRLGEPGERPVALAGDVLRRRIYSPQSYAQVRNSAIVPIVHSECETLASWFPLVWRRREQTLEFVALRGLSKDERMQAPAARALLPVILRAYPFVFDPSQPTGPDTPRMIDDVFADAPTDVGATITTVRHRLSRGTMTRFAFMDRFAREIRTTMAIGRSLADMDAFEPWPLTFDIDGHRIHVPDLFVIRRAAFDDGRFAPLLREHGMSCAQMLSLHRVSLFRAGGLLARAKAFLGQRRQLDLESSESLAPGAAAGRPLVGAPSELIQS